MPDIYDILHDGNPLQRLIFLGAMYITAPPEASEEQVENILNEVNDIAHRLTEYDINRTVIGIRLLVTVEGFPSLSQTELADFLLDYQLDDIDENVQNILDKDSK